jgi:hypothetical protein
MSQKPKILFGVILLAASFVGVAYVGRYLNAPDEHKQLDVERRATTVIMDGPIGNATLDDCIAEAIDLASKGGRRVGLNFRDEKRTRSVIVSPDDTAQTVRLRFEIIP